MSEAVSGVLQDWIANALATRWPGARATRIEPIKGDASMRSFWRLTIEPRHPCIPETVVLVDLGPDDLPWYAKALRLVAEPVAEPPWLNLHRFLTTLGVRVPELYFAAPADRMLIVEDVGELALADAARGDASSAAELYKLALEELFLFHIDGTRRMTPSCLAASIAYDERLFAFELEQFATHGVSAVAPGLKTAALKPELAELAARLGRCQRVLSHRDFHGQNLMVQNVRGETMVRVIDFQDALMAPAAQDLAVLLTTRDTAQIIAPGLETELLDYYLAGLARRSSFTVERGEFIESYRLCVLQHALKMIGRFTFIEASGKPGYSRYLPDCCAQARRMLAQSDDFPGLREAFGVS